jgi:hypothetical protein
MKNPISNANIGLSVYVGDKIVFSEPVISPSKIWIFKSSSVFTATEAPMLLSFTTNSSSSWPISLGIDSVIVNIFYVITDP